MHLTRETVVSHKRDFVEYNTHMKPIGVLA